MTRRLLTTIGSATAVATAVGGCLLLGPTPQAQASTICDPKTGNCVTFSNGGFTATSSTGTGTFTWNPFCVTATSGGITRSFPLGC